MLTAAGTVKDRVDGLGLGADDYLPKPFDFAELVARVRALGRRATPAAPPTLACGDMTLDPAAGWRPAPGGAWSSARRSSPCSNASSPRRRPGRLGRGAARTGLGRGRRPLHHRRQDDHAPAAGQARRPAQSSTPSARAATGSETHDDAPSARPPARLRLRGPSLRVQLTVLYAGLFVGLLVAAVLAVSGLLVRQGSASAQRWHRSGDAPDGSATIRRRTGARRR